MKHEDSGAKLLKPTWNTLKNCVFAIGFAQCDATKHQKHEEMSNFAKLEQQKSPKTQGKTAPTQKKNFKTHIKNEGLEIWKTKKR